MKVNTENIGKHLFITLILFEIFYLVFAGSSSYENISLNHDPVYSMNDDWTYIDENGKKSVISLPAKLNAGEDKTITISRILPDYVALLKTLCLYTTHQSIRAYLDNQMIYSYWEGEDGSYFDMNSTRMWNIIRLPEDASGKTIRLEIKSNYDDYAGDINGIRIGSETSLIVNILNTNSVKLFIAAIILFIGFDLIIIYFSLKKYLKMNKSIVYLGYFSILISIWMAMESTLIQFAAGNSYIISALTYLSLMTVPIPIMLYISSLVNPKFKKLISYLNYFFFFYAFIMISLKFLKLSDFHEGLFVLHAFMFIIWSIVFTILCLEAFKYKNKEIRYITFSFGFLFLFGLLELINYELKTPISIGTFIEFGILIFMVIITLGSIHKIIAVIKLSDDAKYYEYLATRDYLTNCKNRAAYSRELEGINLDHEIAVIMADVNDMKTINDTFGHYVGDEVLVKCSQCLSKIFGSSDHCYRIGGDEFVYIEQNENKEAVKKKAELFLKECETINAECSYNFKISIGFAFYDSKIDEDIYDTVIRADQNMYHRKAVKA